jgi:hypothetical protein
MRKNTREATVPRPTPVIVPLSRRPEGEIWSLPEMRWLVVIACFAIVAMAWSLQHAANETERLNRFAAVLVLELSTEPEVAGRLGTPLSVAGQTSGRVSSFPKAERMEMIVPIAGSRAVGKLYVSATEEHDHWTVTSLVLHVGGERITLDQERVNMSPGKTRER